MHYRLYISTFSLSFFQYSFALVVPFILIIYKRYSFDLSISSSCSDIVKLSLKMRLGSVIPNFKAETTKGPIQFYDWLGDSLVIFLI